LAEGPGRDVTFGEVTGAASRAYGRSGRRKIALPDGRSVPIRVAASPPSPPPHLADPPCDLRVPGQRTTRTGQSAWWMTL
jgi:hypothetical protein